MTQNTVILVIVTLAQLAFLAAILWLLFRLARRARRGQGGTHAMGQIKPAPDGALTLPVRAAFTGVRGLPWWVAVASSSLSPLLVIRSEGLDYRVLMRRSVQFQDIALVDVHTGPGTVNLSFTFRTGPFTFAANLGDEDLAMAALKALPGSILRGPGAQGLQGRD